MKRNSKIKLVVVVFYKGNLLCVCSNMAKANSYAKNLVLESNYRIDKFFFDEQPLI